MYTHLPPQITSTKESQTHLIFAAIKLNKQKPLYFEYNARREVSISLISIYRHNKPPPKKLTHTQTLFPYTQRLYWLWLISYSHHQHTKPQKHAEKSLKCMFLRTALTNHNHNTRQKKKNTLHDFCLLSPNEMRSDVSPMAFEIDLFRFFCHPKAGCFLFGSCIVWFYRVYIKHRACVMRINHAIYHTEPHNQFLAFVSHMCCVWWHSWWALISFGRRFSRINVYGLLDRLHRTTYTRHIFIPHHCVEGGTSFVSN